MATFAIDTETLGNGVKRMNNLAKTVGDMITNCKRVRRALDWDVMGEQQLDKKFTMLCDDLEIIKETLVRFSSCLLNVLTEYSKALPSAEKDVQELKSSVIVYEGQVLGFTGAGGIEDPLRYVNDKYGDGWKETRSSSISGVQNFTQGSLEANANNCVLASITRVMKYYSDMGYSNIPSDINEIYKKVREIGVEHGYDPEKTGFFRDLFVYTPFEIDEMVRDTWKAFGYENVSPDNKYGVFTDQVQVIKENIDNGDPVLLSIPGGDDYGGHTVTVIGYKEFSKEGEENKFFVEIYDGWSQNVRYVDWSVLKEGMQQLRFDENFYSDIASLFNPNSCVTVFGKPKN